MPAPYHTPPANNGPRVIGRPDGAQLQVPAGFSIEEYASDFEKPRKGEKPDLVKNTLKPDLPLQGEGVRHRLDAGPRQARSVGVARGIGRKQGLAHHL